ncbi:MAG: hypothetical protein JSW54_04555 [Fidelibacterota bacterium]|nr:MAG: hypothetical protein JSW54_04555 [Candidatus Neomarinimicrobiota bacterium]
MNAERPLGFGLSVILIGVVTFAQEDEVANLNREYNLVGERSVETHYYLVESDLLIRKPNGKRISVDTYKLHLMIEPGDPSVGAADKFTCIRYSVQRDGGQDVTIPALAGWSYDYNEQALDEDMLDEQGQLYGIPESRFMDLVDETGAKLSFDLGYQVYSTFQYFHSYTQFAEPIQDSYGIQDLKMIGDKIVLESSFDEEPIPGELAEEGSVFRMGESTLEFKGLSMVDDATCAMVGIDWGECSWTMFIKPMPLMKVKVLGGTLCQGIIYMDLETYWVKKLEVTLAEMASVSLYGLIPISKTNPLTRLSIQEVGRDDIGLD